MTGDHDGQAVVTIGSAHGALGARTANSAGHLVVTCGFSERNLLQLVPDGLLKFGTLGIQRHVELSAARFKILLKLDLSLLDDLVLARRRAPGKFFECVSIVFPACADLQTPTNRVCHR